MDEAWKLISASDSSLRAYLRKEQLTVKVRVPLDVSNRFWNCLETGTLGLPGMMTWVRSKSSIVPPFFMVFSPGGYSTTMNETANGSNLPYLNLHLALILIGSLMSISLMGCLMTSFLLRALFFLRLIQIWRVHGKLSSS